MNHPRPLRKSSATLVGLGGYKTAGKDTLAEALREQSPRAIRIMGMSDPLWEMLCAVDPLVPWMADGLGTVRLSQVLSGPLGGMGAGAYVEAKKNPEVRRLLQRLGTEAGRKVLDEDVWASAAARRFHEHAADPKVRHVFLTGVRFPNEAEMVRALGGRLIWVDRPGLSGSGHESETSVGPQDFDAVVLNDSTVERGAGRLAKAILGM